MAKINQTLMKIRDKIKPLLLEMYPSMSEAIDFHHQEGYQEWFGMLFEMKDWQLSDGMIDINTVIMSSTRTKEVEVELESYEGIEDYGFLSVVNMENEYHLIDGYHRVLVGREKGLHKLRGCVWTKVPNKHENCQKIKNLIINNL